MDGVGECTCVCNYDVGSTAKGLYDFFEEALAIRFELEIGAEGQDLGGCLLRGERRCCLLQDVLQ